MPSGAASRLQIWRDVLTPVLTRVLVLQEINEVREYEEGGRKMILTLTIPKDDSVRAVRVFKKVEWSWEKLFLWSSFF